MLHRYHKGTSITKQEEIRCDKVDTPQTRRNQCSFGVTRFIVYQRVAKHFIEHSALTRTVLVRIQVPQPNFYFNDSTLGERVARIATQLPPNYSLSARLSAASVRSAACSSMPGRRCA